MHETGVYVTKKCAWMLAEFEEDEESVQEFEALPEGEEAPEILKIRGYRLKKK